MYKEPIIIHHYERNHQHLPKSSHCIHQSQEQCAGNIRVNFQPTRRPHQASDSHK